ncbi:2-dehydropantoate 2-reductase [Pseudaestuariivita rosea]|uniref:2-dehydropantoate 2-reductase n=1 Tax=Pseudaestuariivita rosea TaxID=2763263 RepID=UPI001ABA5A81|nr:2-dehydropantoate 2-reductase [Pseudaestuariivita rosea]
MTLQKIVILGAGSIGCFVGGHWAAAGADVTLLGRAGKLDALSGGLVLGSDAGQISVAPDRYQLATDPAVLGQADLIVLAIKSHGLPTAIAEITAHAGEMTPVLSLLNGVRPAATLARELPERCVLAGMVPFNVVWKSGNHLHRSSLGQVVVQRSPETAALARQVQDSGAPVDPVIDITSIQYGKLLLNLNNPVNALSGVTLYQQMSDRGFRRIYAAVLEETLTVYRAAGIHHEKVGPMSPGLIIRLLRSPDFLFGLALRIQKLDRDSMTSMAVDLRDGRKTEIEVINQEIVDLAAKTGQTAPLNAKLVDLIHQAEQGGQKVYSAEELAAALGLG